MEIKKTLHDEYVQAAIIGLLASGEKDLELVLRDARKLADLVMVARRDEYRPDRIADKKFLPATTGGPTDER